MIDNSSKLNTWFKPNLLLWGVKVTNVVYQDDFVNKGKIKFGTVVEWEKSSNIAISDPYEGIVAFCHYKDGFNIINFLCKYPPHKGYLWKYYQNRFLIKRKKQCTCHVFVFMEFTKMLLVCPMIVDINL